MLSPTKGVEALSGVNPRLTASSWSLRTSSAAAAGEPFAQREIRDCATPVRRAISDCERPAVRNRLMISTVLLMRGIMHDCVEINAYSRYPLLHSPLMDGKELLRGLLRQAGLNPNSLAALLGKRSLQSQVARFLDGSTRNPRWSTLKPVAEHFKVQVEAFLDPELAATIAQQRGLTEDRSSLPTVKPGLESAPRSPTAAPVPLNATVRAGVFELLMQLVGELERHDLSARKAVASLLGDLALSPENAVTTAERIQRLLDEPGNGQPQKSTRFPPAA